MKIITACSRYRDIDAYAGIIAYAELLQKQGQSAQAVSTAPLNKSITKTGRSWPVSLQTEYTARPDDTFTLIDVSEPGFFDTFVDEERIDKVIDHHPGFEAYWQEKIGDNTDIRSVGAACTQIYDLWQQADLLDQMSETSARLLICGILDNTLNFGAEITTPLDTKAYARLQQIAHLPDDWPARYFTECQESIDEDPLLAIRNDTKLIQFPSRADTLSVGQCAVWDAKEIIRRAGDDLQKYFDAQELPWFINIISISEAKNYLLCTNSELQNWLGGLLHLRFENSLAVTDRLWLRKEIIQAALDQNT